MILVIFQTLFKQSFEITTQKFNHIKVNLSEEQKLLPHHIIIIKLITAMMFYGIRIDLKLYFYLENF